MKPLLFACMLAGYLACPAYGQPTATQETQTLPLPGSDALPFEHLSNEHGLSQHTVYSILQDRNGFLLLALGFVLSSSRHTIVNYMARGERSCHEGQPKQCFSPVYLPLAVIGVPISALIGT